MSRLRHTCSFVYLFRYVIFMIIRQGKVEPVSSSAFNFTCTLYIVLFEVTVDKRVQLHQAEPD